MAKTLVTGGTGFIGSHVVAALAERGDELRLLVRKRSRLDHLGKIDFERRTGDVTERGAVRRALKDVDRVFHVAGATSMRPDDIERVFKVNVAGTRPEKLTYTGSATGLKTALIAVRAAEREVLESISLADGVSEQFPPSVKRLLDNPNAWH